MSISEKDLQLIKALLQHDAEQFAILVGVNLPKKILSDEDATKLLNIAERYSRSEDSEKRQLCLTICGLLWEHRQEHWLAAPAFMMNLLSRIGLAPSMQMIDIGYSIEKEQYSSLGNSFMEAAVTARCKEHEVQIGNNCTLLLSDFQYRAWQLIDQHKRVGISAPTSAGKSHILIHKTLDLLIKKACTIVFIVPTISLIQQVSRDLKITASKLNVNLEVFQSYTPKMSTHHDRIVYVLTQERALSALKQPNAFMDVELLVVDEVQNVERVALDDEDRSRTLYDVIQEFEQSHKPNRIILSGPRVENIAQLTEHLLGKDAQTISAGLPPVLNLTYVFGKDGKRNILKQYTPSFHEPIVIELESEASNFSEVFGKTQYTPKVSELIAEICKRLGSNEGTLIFSPTSKQASETALYLATQGYCTTSETLLSLAEYTAETVHPNYSLVKCLGAGTAYHHGKMPHHIRSSVERAFSNSEIRVLACTTTLMQGVNLPAKNIIALNPKLYTRKNPKKENPHLTAYEFGNLRGRAGRLLKDFVGRAIVLDETAFADVDIGFEFSSKTVSVGYKERFQLGKQQIIEGLTDVLVANDENKSSDLVTYIRQIILKQGDLALERLEKVGISLTQKEYKETQKSLDGLAVPVEVCLACPYWDPLVLDQIYKSYQNGDIPSLSSSPFVTGYRNELLKTLEAMRRITPYYFTKYFGTSFKDVRDDPYFIALAISSQRWSSEDLLKDVINWNDDDDLPANEIDERIKRISGQVMYNLPKMLKPLVAIQATENPLLGFIEMGAYKPETRRLIELGLPRETAIKISGLLDKKKLIKDSHIDDHALANQTLHLSKDFNFWERYQVNDTFSPRKVNG